MNVRGRGSDYSGDKQALYGHENKYTHFSFANLLFVLRTEGRGMIECNCSPCPCVAQSRGLAVILPRRTYLQASTSVFD